VKTNNYQVAGDFEVTTTGVINDLSFQACGIILMNNAAPATLNGLKAGYPGQQVTVYAIGSATVTLANGAAGSLAANRFMNSSGVDVVLPAGIGAAVYQYDSKTQRWRTAAVAVATSGGGGGTVGGSGTIGTLSKWATASTLGNSIISESGTLATVAGTLQAAVGTTAAPSYAFAGAANTGFLTPGAGAVDFVSAGTQTIRFSNNTIAWVGFSPSANLSSDSGGVLAQRNLANPQTFRVYGSYTDSANYERLAVSTQTGSDSFILQEQAGTGVARNLQIGTRGATALTFRTSDAQRWSITSAGHFVATVDAAFDIGSTVSTLRPRNLYLSSNIVMGGQLQATRGVTAGFATSAADPMTSYSAGFWWPRTNDLNQNYIYDYQDEFAFADKRTGVVITVTSAVTPPEATFVLFRDDTNSLSWASGTSPFPITIEVDTSATSIPAAGNGFFNIGLTYRPTGAPVITNIKIESWESGAYVTKYDQAPATPPIGNAWLSPRFAGDTATGFALVKCKVTLSGTNPLGGSDIFRLQRLMLYHPTAVWDPWRLHKGGGTLYGTVLWSANNGAIDHLVGPSDQPFVLRAGAGQEFRIKDNAGTVRLTGTSLGFTVNGTLSVTGVISGNGSGLTNLPAAGLTGTIAAAQMPALTGDVTSTAGTTATTLAAVNANVGTFGSVSQAVTLTVNAKGLVTAISQTPMTVYVGGSGTTGRLPKFVSAGSLGDSLLSESGSTVTFWNAATPVLKIINNAAGSPGVGGAIDFLQYGAADPFLRITPSPVAAVGRIVWNYNNGNGVRVITYDSADSLALKIVSNNATDTGTDTLGLLLVGTLCGSWGSGGVADQPGGDLKILGGRATGSALGGSLLFQTSDPIASGTTRQPITTKMTLSAAGALTVTGGVTAASFTGSGATLTNLPAANLTGTVPAAQMPAFTGGDVTSSAGTVNLQLAAGAIVNADVNAVAAIAWTKIDKTGALLSDLGGMISYAQLPTGAGTWTADPLIVGHACIGGPFTTLRSGLNIYSEAGGAGGAGARTCVLYGYDTVEGQASTIKLLGFTATITLGTTVSISTSASVSGTLTATTFSGSGASLTNLPAANLTGNMAYSVLPTGSGTWSGTPTITGLLTLSSGQIAFPATQNPSSDPNTFDDYREGTWTPSLTSSGGGSATYFAQVGYYHKKGSEVHASGYINMTSKGTLAAGNVSISGLPFTTANLSNHYSVANMSYWGQMAVALSHLSAFSAPNSTSCLVVAVKQGSGLGSVQTLTVADITNTVELMFDITYRATS
jgi:hypothetical protein